MDVLQHIGSRDLFGQKINEACERFSNLNSEISKVLSPGNKPHLLFHYGACVHQKAKEFRVIVERLYRNRLELLKCDFLMDHAQPKDWPGGTPYPPEYNEITKQAHAIDEEIVLDFQMMLLFAGIALDDWAHLAACVVGLPNPSRSSFDIFAKNTKPLEFQEIWSEHQSQILWLDAFVRLFRNKMLVHRESPWQIGHSRSSYFLDWSFWMPIAVGWIPEEERSAKHKLLSTISDAIDVRPSENIHTLIYDLLCQTSNLHPSQRKTVYDCAETFGFQTPTFQTFAHNVADFLHGSTNTLLVIANRNPQRINLGPSPYI